MRRWLLRWLLDGEDVYVAVRQYPARAAVGIDVFDVHTDFDGANEQLAGRGGEVYTVTFVVD